MWWQFRSAFVRKLGYILAALLIGLVLHGRAHAQTFVWNMNAGFVEPRTATGAAMCSVDAGYQGNGAATYTVASAVPSGAPTASGQSLVCNLTGTRLPPSSGTFNLADGGVSVSGTAASCPVGGTQDVLTAIAASTFTSNTGEICIAGCGWVNGSSAMVITGSAASGGQSLIGSAVASGQACGAGAAHVSTPPLAVSNCMESGGTIACHSPTQGVATVNADIVNPSSPPPPGQCSGFADGSVVCNAGSGGTLSIVAGPRTGSGGGTPAVPAIVVTTPTDTENYYTAAQAAASTAPIGLVNSGTTTGNASGNSAGGPCTPSAVGVTPVITCTGTSVSVAGSGSGSGAAACPLGQTCTGSGDSVSGGQDCDAPPACLDTDPVLCGIVNQQWLERCATFTTAQLTTVVGDPNDGGTVDSTTVDASTVTNETLITASGGTCPAPVTFTMFGHTVSYDLWSGLCSFATAISAVLLIVAYMIAARVFFLGVTANSLG